ncbi:MAG: class I SAM-dependent RNA methyltransferase [Gemmatimonas sp.]|uniref:THUMP domain-containing class I SAM-dependent RNA methyltransferase n=1 Tax=Gemmatimonas sp. TaxID=1962908 RepID=UPI00391FAE8A
MPPRPRKPTTPTPAAQGTAAPPARLEAFAVAAPGFAPLIAAECVALGLSPREVTPAGVALELTPAELFTLNCWTRLASRVLVRLAHFGARDFATLEKQAARVPWARVVHPGASVRLRVTCRKSRLYHSDAVAERVARGLAAGIAGAQVSGRARDDEEDDGTDETAPAQLIVVRLDHDRCTISADSSGTLLHRRGWRMAVAKAPLRETLAAMMLAAVPWDGGEPLVDPFCGSGTIGIEAALRARHMAPGLARRFAMERWPGADAAACEAVRAAARAAVRPGVGVPIVLRDRDAGAITAARANAERAGVLGDLIIEQGALSETDLAALGPRGLLLTNPPYGMRVSDGADLRGLYARLGDVLRAGGPGWHLGLLVPHDRALAGQLRLRLTPAVHTTNGGLPVELLLTPQARK